MKITGVRSQLYEYELSRPIGDANFPNGVRRRSDLAVFVDTSDGVTGATVGSARAKPVLASLAPLIVGEDPRSVRGLWQRMVDAAFKGGTAGTVALAISAVDCALWDLRAKLNGVPLWKELGAVTPRVRAYASGLDSPLDDDALRNYYEAMARRGVRAGKLKVGREPDADLRRLQILQDALGGAAARPSLMVDANEYWSPKQAIRRMHEIEQSFDIVWCEEPARRWDHRGLRQVSRAIRAAVATGENLTTREQFMALLTHDAVDVVQISAFTGGVTGALQVAELAAAFELPVAMMNSPARSMAHLAAALPNHLMMEVLDVGRDAVFSFDAAIEDGWIVLGDRPGNGIVFDEERLARHAVTAPDPGTVATSGARGELAGLREGPWTASGSGR